MGFTQRKSGNVTYLNLANGKFVESVDKGHPDAVERVNKNGKTVYEKHYDGGLEGIITNITFQDSEWVGREMAVEMSDVDEKYLFKMPLSSRYTKTFFAILPNIDTERNVEIVPYSYKPDDKIYVGVFANQGGKKIEKHFTRENPDGMPEMIEVMVKGKLVWDDTDQQRFIEKYIKENYAFGVVADHESQPIEETAQPLPNEPDESTSDLPF